MLYPIHNVQMPSELATAANGRVEARHLVSVGPAGLLVKPAARAFVAMQGAAKAAGYELTYTYGGTYRSYVSQVNLFLSRYTLEFLAGRPSKVWNGKRYYQLPGTAMAAVPGTSNHGWGLAVDLALDIDPSDGVGPDDAVSIGPALNWLFVNAERFGFSWEVQSEPWHVRYVNGDDTPPAVVAYELKQAAGVVAASLEDDDMKQYVMWRPKGYANTFLIGGGGIIHLSPGLHGYYKSQGVQQLADEDHPQLLKQCLQASGLSQSDLVAR